MVTLAAVFIRTNGRFTHLAVTRSTTRCTRSPRIPRFSCPGTLCSHLLRIPHARPVSFLPAHAAPSYTDIVAPAHEQEVPRRAPVQTSCRSSSSVHHALSPSTALNSQRSLAATVPHPCAPQPPLSGPPWPGPSASACDSHPESARRTGLRARGSCCANPRPLVGPLERCICPCRSAVWAAEAGLRCVDDPARSARK